MLADIFHIVFFVAGVTVGAYSHKWLAKVTGAPANLTVAGVEADAVKMAQAVGTAAKKV